MLKFDFSTKENSSDEFYIGYVSKAPDQNANFNRKVVIVIGIMIVVVCTLIPLSQRSFSDSIFEFDTMTTVVGLLSDKPFPHIRTWSAKDSMHHIVPLVGYGKHGAEKTIETREVRSAIINGVLVRMKGNIISGRGKTILQVATENDIDVLPMNYDSGVTPTLQLSFANTDSTITGEVVDSKCYFGVMKPGEGKPHRSCAIRCIAGGIPPVFKSKSGQHYLMLDELNTPVNELVLDIVGDQVELTGRVAQFGDWKVLTIKKDQLRLLASQVRSSRIFVEMNSGITFCADFSKK